MSYSAQEVMQFVEENDIKFIRLAFCDIWGNQKNISIMPSQLPRAFSGGVAIDGSAIPGFGDEAKSDLFLLPDPDTLQALPWRPSHGRVVRMYCTIRKPDGSAFPLCGRTLLKNAVKAAADRDIGCHFGAECEFYLFQLDQTGNPTLLPFDQAGYMDIAPDDKGENVRREICLTLEEMGFTPMGSHHEQGPGQNEIGFHFAEPLQAADDLTTFKAVVKTIAARNGLHASFRPKPLPEREGNGLHVNMSPFRLSTGEPAMGDRGAFLAGILRHIEEMTLFLNPTAESYLRLGQFKAPKYITWSPENRSQLIRVPAVTSPENSRVELRSPDPGANPYIAYTLLLHAGLEGIITQLSPPSSTDRNLFSAPEDFLQTLRRLPLGLDESRRVAGHSAFLKCLPEALRRAYLQ